MDKVNRQEGGKNRRNGRMSDQLNTTINTINTLINTNQYSSIDTYNLNSNQCTKPSVNSSTNSSVNSSTKKYVAHDHSSIFLQGRFRVDYYSKDRYIVERLDVSRCAIFSKLKSAKSVIRLVSEGVVPNSGSAEFYKCLIWLSIDEAYVKRVYRILFEKYPEELKKLPELYTGNYIPEY